MTLLFESVFSNEHRLVLFGAGHVGSRVASMLRARRSAPRWSIRAFNGWRSRPLTNLNFPKKRLSQRRFGGYEHGDLVLIMTHDHVLDYEIVRAVLNVKGLSYIGLIGSMTKWKIFRVA